MQLSRAMKIYTNFSPIIVEKKEKVKTKQTIEVITKISSTNVYLHITITIQLSSSYCVHVIDFQKLYKKNKKNKYKQH